MATPGVGAGPMDTIEIGVGQVGATRSGAVEEGSGEEGSGETGALQARTTQMLVSHPSAVHTTVQVTAAGGRPGLSRLRRQIPTARRRGPGQAP